MHFYQIAVTKALVFYHFFFFMRRNRYLELLSDYCVLVVRKKHLFVILSRELHCMIVPVKIEAKRNDSNQAVFLGQGFPGKEFVICLVAAVLPLVIALELFRKRAY
jgi:hypothetical protein